MITTAKHATKVAEKYAESIIGKEIELYDDKFTPYKIVVLPVDDLKSIQDMMKVDPYFISKPIYSAFVYFKNETHQGSCEIESFFFKIGRQFDSGTI